MHLNQTPTHMSSEKKAWHEAAYKQLLLFLLTQGLKPGGFMVEDVRPFAEERGLVVPPNGSAWGAVMVRAKREGRIHSIGHRYRKSTETSNTALGTVWALTN